jgi:hypothetical protein
VPGVGFVNCRSWESATPRTTSWFGVSVGTGLVAVLAPAGGIGVDVAVLAPAGGIGVDVAVATFVPEDVGVGVRVAVAVLVD